MTKNVYDLIVAIVGGVEVIADGVFAYLGVTGTLDPKVSTSIAGSVTIAGSAVLAICSRFIKDAEITKENKGK